MKFFIEKIIEKIKNQPYQAFMIAAISVLILLGIINEFQRKAAVADIKRASVSNRRMLNSRARIQIILINSTLEGRRLNAAEIDCIKQLWHTAEYDQSDDAPPAQ